MANLFPPNLPSPRQAGRKKVDKSKVHWLIQLLLQGPEGPVRNIRYIFCRDQLSYRSNLSNHKDINFSKKLSTPWPEILPARIFDRS